MIILIEYIDLADTCMLLRKSFEGEDGFGTRQSAHQPRFHRVGRTHLHSNHDDADSIYIARQQFDCCPGELRVTILAYTSFRPFTPDRPRHLL